MRINHLSVTSICLLLLVSSLVHAQESTDGKWRQLFNGKDLDGWAPKITGHAWKENFGNTFRVENGVLKVSYDQYRDFANQFGHLFYKDPFSNYRLRI